MNIKGLFCFVLQDFLQNLVHHILTLMLLAYSFSSGYYHIGAIIVYVHDVSDVFLEVSKPSEKMNGWMEMIGQTMGKYIEEWMNE